MAGLFLPPADSMETTMRSSVELAPEQRDLLGLQAKQFRQLSPLQVALGQAQAGMLGFRQTQPTRRVQVSGGTPAFAGIPARAFGQPNVVTGGTVNSPEDAEAMGLQGVSANTWMDPNTGERYTLGSSVPSTAPGMTSIAGTPGSPGTPPIFQDVPDLNADPTWEYTGQSPLISAMQSSYRLRPEELAVPGAIGQTSRSMADALRGATADYTGRATGIADRARYLSELGIVPIDTGPQRAAFDAAGRPINFDRASAARAFAEAEKPLDTAALMDPLNYAFSGEGNPNSVMAQLRTAAIRAGHSPDVASSGYNKLLTGATREYGSGLASVLANAELQRRQGMTQAASGMTQAEQAAAMAELGRRTGMTQAATGVTQAESEQAMNELRNKMTNLQGLQTAGGINADIYNAQAGQLAPLYQFLMAGPQAEAGIAGLQRQLAGQEAGVPLSLLRGNTISIPGAPTYPGTETSVRQNDPSTGSQVGAGLNQALLFGLLGPQAFSNIAGLFGTGAGGSAAGASLFGGPGAAGAASPLMSALGMGCWIAELLYGKASPKVSLLRAWLFGKHRNSRASRLYLKYGERFAAWLKQHPIWQRPVRMLFDRWVKLAEQELCPTA